MNNATQTVQTSDSLEHDKIARDIGRDVGPLPSDELDFGRVDPGFHPWENNDSAEIAQGQLDPDFAWPWDKPEAPEMGELDPGFQPWKSQEQPIDITHLGTIDPWAQTSGKMETIELGTAPADSYAAPSLDINQLLQQGQENNVVLI